MYKCLICNGNYAKAHQHLQLRHKIIDKDVRSILIYGELLNGSLNFELTRGYFRDSAQLSRLGFCGDFGKIFAQSVINEN